MCVLPERRKGNACKTRDFPNRRRRSRGKPRSLSSAIVSLEEFDRGHAVVSHCSRVDPGEDFFRRKDGRYEGHRIDSRQRESSINQLLRAETKRLQCPQVEENARTCAVFSIFLQRTRKMRTDWRGDSHSNPEPLSQIRMLPGGHLKNS